MSTRVIKIEFQPYSIGNQTEIGVLQDLTSGTERRQATLVSTPVDLGLERQVTQRSAVGVDATGATIYFFGRDGSGGMVEQAIAGAAENTSVFTDVSMRWVDEVWVEGPITGGNVSFGTGGNNFVDSAWRLLNYKGNSEGITAQAYTLGSTIDFDVRLTLADPTYPYDLAGIRRGVQPEFSDRFDRAAKTLNLPFAAPAAVNNLASDGAAGTVAGPWVGVRVRSNVALTTVAGVLIAQGSG
jgi:hypothetical protein